MILDGVMCAILALSLLVAVDAAFGALRASADALRREEQKLQVLEFAGCCVRQVLPHAKDIVLLRKAPARLVTGAELKLRAWLNSLHGPSFAEA